MHSLHGFYYHDQGSSTMFAMWHKVFHRIKGRRAPCRNANNTSCLGLDNSTAKPSTQGTKGPLAVKRNVKMFLQCARISIAEGKLGKYPVAEAPYNCFVRR